MMMAGLILRAAGNPCTQCRVLAVAAGAVNKAGASMARQAQVAPEMMPRTLGRFFISHSKSIQLSVEVAVETWVTSIAMGARSLALR